MKFLEKLWTEHIIQLLYIIQLYIIKLLLITMWIIQLIFLYSDVHKYGRKKVIEKKEQFKYGKNTYNDI